MTTLNTPTSCRYCQYYKPLGRRGGACEMLNVSVQGAWKGCHLAMPLFKPLQEGEKNCTLVNSR